MGKGGRKLTNGIDGRAKGRTLLLNTPTSSGKRLTKGFEKTHLSFSFLYFRQIPFFELDDQDNRWFVSLLERLKDLSGKNSSILGDTTAKQAYRIHPIAWQSGGQASDYSPQKLLRIYREKSANAGRNRIFQRLLRLYADSEINVLAVTEMK